MNTKKVTLIAKSIFAFALILSCVFAVGETASATNSCPGTRVDIKNSTDYAVSVQIVDWNIGQPLAGNAWFNCPGYGCQQTLTLKATYKGYTTTQSFRRNSNCNIRVRLVRLSPGVIRFEEF